MKSKRKIALTCVMAAVMLAGSSIAAFAAENPAPVENSSGISAAQDAEEKATKKSADNGDASEKDSTAKPERIRKNKKNTDGTETGTEDSSVKKTKPSKSNATAANGETTDETGEKTMKKHGRKHTKPDAEQITGDNNEQNDSTENTGKKMRRGKRGMTEKTSAETSASET